jgi:hypothetical protein
LIFRLISSQLINSNVEMIKMNFGRVFLPAMALIALSLAPAAAAPLAAPMPLIGASLPGLAIGYGAYWLIKRRRNTN